MAKKIVIKYEDKSYTLEYTRASVRALDSIGFKIDEITDYPVTRIPQLFAGAFVSKHRFLDKDKIEEIYAAMPDKINLIVKLRDMYKETVDVLFNNDEEGTDEGNGSWEETE